MRFTDDIASGTWMRPRLYGCGVVGGTVPRGFEAYARVFHPVSLSRVIPESWPTIERASRPFTWAETAARFGTTAHAAMQWGGITRWLSGQIDLGDGWELEQPEEGSLEPGRFAALARVLAQHATVDAVTAGIWNGWGELTPDSTGVFFSAYPPSTPAEVEEARRAARERLAAAIDPQIGRAVAHGPWLELPGREYILLAGALAELLDEDWPRHAGIGWPDGGTGHMPNLLWPADRSWCVASEIDFDSTLVGGARALIEDVLASPALESAPVSEDTDLTIDGDRINPPRPRLS